MSPAATHIPVADLSRFLRGSAAEKRRVARETDRAFRESGFLLVAGHGVPASVLRSADRAARAFFDLPAQEKAASAARAPKATRGYLASGRETLSYGLDRRSPPDLSESFVVGPVEFPKDRYHVGPSGRRYFQPNVWPRRPRGFAPALTRYYRAMERLSTDLLGLFAAALELEPDFFDDKTDKHISRLRARHYPALPAAPRPGQLRAGPHTDYGVMTILHADAAVAGLEVQAGPGRWEEVPLVEGAFVVNIGDLMARWTNDRWASTLHRVSNEALARRRLTLAYFHYPNYDVEVACLPTCRDPRRPPRYAPIAAGAHLSAKLLKTVRGRA